MSWTSSGITRTNTIDEVHREWASLYDELPTGTADSNELRNYGEFSNEKDARKKLESANIVGMGYVKINAGKGKETAVMRDTKILLAKEKQKYSDFYIAGSVYKTHSGKSVGCTRCGSSFPVAYFRRDESTYHYPSDLLEIYGERNYINHCPVCMEEMRSKTTLSRLDGYRKNIKKCEDRLKELENKALDQAYYLFRINAYCG